MGVLAETVVGICVERSLEMVIAILGTLKAGGAYVPLDPAYPNSRLELILEDSQAQILIIQSHLLEQLPKSASIVVDLNKELTQIGTYPDDNPVGRIRPDNLAYIIYTSGTTGQPKGVMIQHDSVVNMIISFNLKYHTDQTDKVLQQASFSFDVSVGEIFPVICAGGTLVIASKDVVSNPDQFALCIEQNEITIFGTTPSLLSHLRLESYKVPKLRLIFSGGEALSYNNVSHLPDSCVLVNGYGPTEATIGALAYTLNTKKTRENHKIPIGKPLNNYRIYVLDKKLKHQPIGVPGELCIAGVGLARGYLNHKQLTEEKFIEIKVLDKSQRLYKTGDLARWLPDGNLEYLGRVDRQIKLRGFRIELSEIEVTLSLHDSVGEAVVLLHKQIGNPRLIAYVTLSKPIDEPAAILRSLLKENLPEYMVPAGFIVLDKLPLTPNGKIDHAKLLTLPIDNSLLPENQFVSPRTSEEHLLSDIWADVLALKRVGIYDNFFDIGGHSLLATRLLVLINEAFMVELPLRNLFETPTVHGLAQSIVMYRQTGTNLLTNASEIDFNTEKTLEPSIQPITTVRPETITDPQLILLTGTTGFLGVHLLYELLMQTNADINCLVRSSYEEGSQRICKTLKSYSLWNESFRTRIIPTSGDLAKPLLGLSQTEFNDLANRIDVIYHNGAWVNHIYPYQVLKAANVSGTLEILKLATQAVSKPVHYISTYSHLLSTDPDIANVSLNNIVKKINHGYVQSKWVAEQLVQQAGERGLPVSIYRPRRVIGHNKTGVSNQNDFISLLMKGCIQLKMIPDLNCVEENLIPVDYTANAIVYLSRQINSLQQTFELTNPQNTNWKTLFNKLRSMGYKLEQTPYEQWREKLNSRPGNALYPLLSLFPKMIPEDSQKKNEETKHPLFDQELDKILTAANIICPTINGLLLENYFSYFIDDNFFDAP